MTLHDSTLLYWQSKHVDWVFVLDRVLCDSKKGGDSPYDRDRTMLMIKNEPYRKLMLKYETMYIIHAKGHTLCESVHIVYSVGGHQRRKGLSYWQPVVVYIRSK